MTMNAKMLAMVGLAAILLATGGAMADPFGTGANQFTIEFVTIPAATNPAGGYGIVNNDYRMGIYEITNDQWNKFTDSFGEPNGNPSGAYDEDPYWTAANLPTNQVSWYEAAQFVNWLNTSTGHHAAYKFTGTRGTGDYTLAAWSAAEADNGTDLYRHKDAFYYLPTEDEWVRAAYWGETGLQTYSNASPSDLVSGVPDPAKWNYSSSAENEPWAVGSGVLELNGTFDMMGHVWEWMESPHNDPSYGTSSNRALRGGSYYAPGIDNADALASSYRGQDQPEDSGPNGGFRVASDIPEPASLALLSLGGLAIIRQRRGRRKTH